MISVPGGKRRRRLTVLNQLEDFNRLIATLSEHARPVRAVTGSLPSSNAIHRRILSLPWTKRYLLPMLGRLSVAKSQKRLLADIYQTARSSVGLPIAPDSDAARLFRLVLDEGRSLITQRNEIEDRAIELLKTNGDYQLLASIPGIGPINALTILAEAGDLRRFQHHRQFLKFCGMDLATIQSGTFRGQTKLSKYGNARLRCHCG